MFAFLLSFLSLPVSTPVANQPVAAVVPHHNIVASTRLESLQRIAALRPKTKTIILIGPDHFSVNQRQLLYSNEPWSLNQGQINFASTLLPQLSPYLSLQNGIVKNDHAIFNLLLDIKTTFPSAALFPILLGQQIPLKSLESLAKTISSICTSDCLLLATVDFSHYLPWALADVHDQKTLYDLSALNISDLSNVEVDSQQSLYVLLNFARSRSAPNFHLLAHTNSAKLSGLRDTESTSHVCGYYSSSSVNSYHPPKPFTFTFTPTTDRKTNQTSLGDRFFYGVDAFNPTLRLPFPVRSGFIVSGYQTSQTTHLVFTPYRQSQNRFYLLRDDAKTKALSKLFISLKPPLSSVADVPNGTLFYGTRTSSSPGY